VERAAELGDYALARLRELAARHPLIRDVRGKGLLLGLELVRPVRENLPRPGMTPVELNGCLPATNEAEAVMYAALRRGLNFKVTMGNLLTLTPALTITRAELDQAIGILDASLDEVTAAPALLR
jgi:4-aminobutyrate aminotransferase